MLGIDLVEISEIIDKNENFIKHVLSEKEYQIYQSFKLIKTKNEFLAGRFAAKEAIFKAFSKGDMNMSFKDISILNEENGKPYIEIYNQRSDLEISISHSKNYVVAIVLKNI